jgi:hypothetical protein
VSTTTRFAGAHAAGGVGVGHELFVRTVVSADQPAAELVGAQMYGALQTGGARGSVVLTPPREQQLITLPAAGGLPPVDQGWLHPRGAGGVVGARD